MRSFAPARRFSAVELPAPTERFDPEEPSIHTIPDDAVYTCPRCSERIQLHLRNFQEAACRPVSRLSAEDDREMSKVHGALRAGESFLDWYCPGCRQAIRVYYSGYVADKGIFFVELTRVLESA